MSRCLPSCPHKVLGYRSTLAWYGAGILISFILEFCTVEGSAADGPDVERGSRSARSGSVKARCYEL